MKTNLFVPKFSLAKVTIQSQMAIIFRTVTFGRIEIKLGNVNPRAESLVLW